MYELYGSNREPQGDTAPSIHSATIGYYWSLFAVGLGVAAIGPALPRLAANTGSTLATVSIVFAAYRAGGILGALGGGALLDRVPRNATIAGAMLGVALSIAAVPVVTNLVVLAAVFLGVGVTSGVLEVGSNTLLIWNYRSRVGPYMVGLHFAFGFGAMLAPTFIGRSTALAGTIAPAFFLAAALVLPGILVLIASRTPAAEGSSGVGGEVAEDRIDVRLTTMIAGFLALYVGAESAFGGWIYTYSAELGLVTRSEAAYLTSLFWGALTAGRLLAVPFAARFSPHRLLMAGSGGAIVSTLVLIAAAVHSSVAHVWAIPWIAAGGVGLSMAAIFPSAISFAGRRMRITGRVSRWFWVGAGIGGMLIPWGLGRLMELFGAEILMIGVLATLCAMALMLIALPSLAK